MLFGSTENPKKTIASLLILMPFAVQAGDNYGFNWDIVGREMGLDMDEESFAALQREMAVGHHPYEIYYNNHFMGEETVDIALSEVDESSLVVSIPARVYQKMRLKREALAELYQLDPSEFISDIERYLPGTVVDLEESTQSIRITVPQIFEDSRNRTFLAPQLWNYGIPALRLSYNADFSESKRGDLTYKDFYASGDAQLNLGRWRLSGRFNATKSNEEEWNVEAFERHASTLVPQWGAKLKVGEFTTNSQYISGIPLIGVSLYEDSEQVDPVDDDYFPVIAGYANSAAQITIRQGNHILRQTDVAPGPYEFDDVRLIGNSGDIDVEVKEYSGKVTTYTIPYTLSDKLLKPNRFSWSVSGGRYDDGVTDEHPWVVQFAGGYGFSNGWTSYGGSSQSEVFQQYVLGSAWDIGQFGALALQLENSQISNRIDRHGTTAELSWSKYFELSESNLEFSYRHTMEGNIGSIGEALSYASSDYPVATIGESDFIKDEASFYLSKTVGDWGSVFGSMVWSQTNQGYQRQSLSGSWNFPLGRLNGTFQVQSSKEENELNGKTEDWSVSLRLNIPFSVFEGFRSSNAYVSASSVFMKDGEHANQLELTANYGDEGEWNTLLTLQEHSETSEVISGQVDYRSAYGQFGLNGSYSEDVSRLSARVSGGVLVTQHRLVFTDNMYGSVALVNVPDGNEAKLKNTSGSGEWLVVNGMSNFVENDISLDPDSLQPNLTVIGGYERQTIPADNAVIEVNFNTFLGEEAVFHVQMPDGTPMQYGALVSVEDLPVQLEPSVSDEAGIVYFTSVPSKGRLTVRWREDSEVKSCPIEYELTPDDSGNEIHELTVTCRSVTDSTANESQRTDDEDIANETDQDLESLLHLDANDIELLMTE